MKIVDSENWIVVVGDGLSLLVVAFRGFTFRVGLSRRLWRLGRHEEWYDGPIPVLTLGPLGSVSWMYSFHASWHNLY